jgi:hypothetical protein
MLIFLPMAILLVIYVNETFSDALNQTLKEGFYPLCISAAIVVSVLSIVLFICMAVHPEGFKNPDQTDQTELIQGITEAESKTCALISRADSFIEGDVGPKGMTTDKNGDTVDTPLHRQYVVDAQIDARKKVPGELVSCPGVLPSIDDRLLALERSLIFFVGPIFLRNFNSSINSSIACSQTKIPCVSPNLVSEPLKPNIYTLSSIDQKRMLWKTPSEDQMTRLLTIKDALICYESQLLKPIDQQTQRMKNGQISDCERKNSAKSGISNR